MYGETAVCRLNLQSLPGRERKRESEPVNCAVPDYQISGGAQLLVSLEPARKPTVHHVPHATEGTEASTHIDAEAQDINHRSSPRRRKVCRERERSSHTCTRSHPEGPELRLPEATGGVADCTCFCPKLLTVALSMVPGQRARNGSHVVVVLCWVAH